MSQIYSQIFQLFFFPPAIFIVFLLLSVIFIKSIQRLKIALVMQIFFIYILSIPLTSEFLFANLEMHPALNKVQIQRDNMDVIVVLAGGIKAYTKEFHGPDIGYFTLLRLRYTAWLQQRTGLPVIVTGGIERGGITEAELMKQTLQNEYGITSKIHIEKQSHNTYENSIYSNEIMHEYHYKKYYLVTSAFHMPRALDVFKKYNENVIAAPMGFYFNQTPFDLGKLKPHSRTLWHNYLALHEIIGRYWYRMYY